MRNILVVQCHTPTDNSGTKESDAFYEKLTAILERLSKGHLVIEIGGLNAKDDANNSFPEHMMGKWGLDNLSLRLGGFEFQLLSPSGHWWHT